MQDLDEQEKIRNALYHLKAEPYIQILLMNQKSLVSILIVLTVLATGGYLLYQNQSRLPSLQSITQPVDETINWKTYTNEKYGYSIKYPPDWTVTDKTKEYEDLTVLDAQWFNDDGKLELSSEEASIILHSAVNISMIKNRTGYGDAGHGAETKTTTTVKDGKEIIMVETTSSALDSQGEKWEETGKSYTIYIPVGKNFFILDGDLQKKEVIEKLASTFKPTSKTEGDYLPEVVKKIKQDLAQRYNQDPSEIIVETVQLYKAHSERDRTVYCKNSNDSEITITDPVYRIGLREKDGQGRSHEYYSDKNDYFCFSY